MSTQKDTRKDGLATLDRMLKAGQERATRRLRPAAAG